jgi:uncharacterized membrane protein (UPF0127 family)
MVDSLRAGESCRSDRPCFDMSARRLRRLPTTPLFGREVPVAAGAGPRLLGLALLRRRQAGPGLLLPSCAAVHTVGMLFRLDLIFLDGRGQILREQRGVGPFRFAACRGAESVLELVHDPPLSLRRRDRGYSRRVHQFGRNS